MKELPFNTNEEMWTDFELAVKNIFKLVPITIERYMQVHWYVYKYCTVSQNQNDEKIFYDSTVNSELYMRVCSFLQHFLRNISRELRHLPEKDLLSFYAQKWDDYKFSANTLDGLCAYVNRIWVRREREDGRKDIHKFATLARIMWRDFVFLNVKKGVISGLLKLIEQDRVEGLTNSTLISRTIESLVEISVDENYYSHRTNLTFYRLHFEEIFFKKTAEFYTRESFHFLARNSVIEYMKKVEEILEQEMKRVHTFLHSSTAERLEKICVEVLIKKHLPVIQAEFKNLLDANKVQDLARMNLLLSKVPNGFSELIPILDNYIGNTGVSAIENCADVAANNPNLYVTTILKVYKKYRSLVQNTFKNNIAFVAVLDKAFSRFVNSNAVTKIHKSSRSSELLAKYCDIRLTMRNKNRQDVELDNALDQAIKLFNYIDDKDIFLTFYKKLFAQRLINQTSISEEAELAMITKLKETCGFEYTSKLQRMFKDIGLSKELNEIFKSHRLYSANSLDVEFNIQVLSSGFWPFKAIDFMIPDQLQKYVRRFNEFHEGHFTGRKLYWAHNLARGELHTNCFKQKYVLQASTLQISVLLMFNTSLSYTVEQLIEGTGSPMELMKQLVHIFLKTKLLLCDDEEVFQLTSVIKLNKNFKNKKLKININMPLKMVEQTEQMNMAKYIEGDRNIMIQAAIVRIMKMRKTMKQQELAAEVLKQMSKKFIPTIPMVKKGIDMMLDKQFIERQPNEKDTINYLA